MSTLWFTMDTMTCPVTLSLLDTKTAFPCVEELQMARVRWLKTHLLQKLQSMKYDSTADRDYAVGFLSSSGHIQFADETFKPICLDTTSKPELGSLWLCSRTSDEKVTAERELKHSCLLNTQSSCLRAVRLHKQSAETTATTTPKLLVISWHTLLSRKSAYLQTGVFDIAIVGPFCEAVEELQKAIATLEREIQRIGKCQKRVFLVPAPSDVLSLPLFPQPPLALHVVSEFEILCVPNPCVLDVGNYKVELVVERKQRCCIFGMLHNPINFCTVEQFPSMFCCPKTALNVQFASADEAIFIA